MENQSVSSEVSQIKMSRGADLIEDDNPFYTPEDIKTSYDETFGKQKNQKQSRADRDSEDESKTTKIRTVSQVRKEQGLKTASETFNEDSSDEPEEIESADENQEEEVQKLDKKDVEYKRLKNAVPALQRQANQLMNKNKELERMVAEFDNKARSIAEQVAERVWNHVSENFDEVQEELLKKRGVNPEDYLRDKFIERVRLENMDEEQRKVYQENQELRRKMKEVERQRMSVEQERQQHQEKLQQRERAEKFSQVAQYAGGLMKKFGLPENDNVAAQELVQSLIDVAERAESDPMLANLSEEDIASHYADTRWKNHVSLVGKIDWSNIADKPEAKAYLEHCQRIVKSALSSGGGATVQRDYQPKRQNLKSERRVRDDDYITEADMYALMRKGKF